jgi:hypothetical protein
MSPKGTNYERYRKEIDPNRYGINKINNKPNFYKPDSD